MGPSHPIPRESVAVAELRGTEGGICPRVQQARGCILLHNSLTKHLFSFGSHAVPVGGRPRGWGRTSKWGQPLLLLLPCAENLCYATGQLVKQEKLGSICWLSLVAVSALSCLWWQEWPLPCKNLLQLSLNVLFWVPSLTWIIAKAMYPRISSHGTVPIGKSPSI